MKLSTLSVLFAAEDLDRVLYAAEAATVQTDTEARNMSGLLVPYGVVGYTSVGPVVVPGPGRIDIPEDLTRVKLVRDHPTVDAFGHMSAVRDTPDGLRGAFRVGRTPLGDQALLEASEHVRDAFSVELTHIELTNSGELVRARLKAVATPIVPAWADARADGLAASHTPTHTKGSTMLTDEERARLQALLAKPAGDRTEEEASELRTLLAKAGEDAGEEDTEEETSEESEEETAEVHASHRSTPARIRRQAPARVPARRRTRSLQDLYAAMANAYGHRSNPAELQAALSDITSTANVWTSQDEYGGLLWEGVEYQRQYVPLMLPGDLPSYKGTGWRWVVKPTVGDYAGDKAAVPSNAPTTEEVTWMAARLAGAHDLDRKFMDFGDAEFIESYFQQMRESYAIQSDAKARLWILANAVNAGAAGVGTTIWHAAAKSAQAVFDATGGLTPDYILVNSTDTFALLDVPSSDMPSQEVLDMFGVTSDKFKVTPGVAAGTVVSGVRQAGRFRELSGSPIRVEALNIANGGVDGGVFGYYATQEAFDGGIQSATFGA